jgi:hypothetical protein
LCGPKATAIKGYPVYAKGKYIRSEFEPELSRLGDELLEHNPNLILALGATAMWALLGRTAIKKFRGTTDLSTHTVQGFKVLGTYHPAAIFRAWNLRPIISIDLGKAERERHFPNLERPKREIWIEPSLKDLEDFYDRYLERANRLSVDIETAGTQITCIGFAPTPEVAIVIPFNDPRKPRRNYWANSSLERDAWRFVERVLALPIPKIFQNGLYDIAFIFRSTGIRVNVPTGSHDTMLLHHALQPESPKDLGFLGSLYCDEGAWKHMRVDNRTIKRDE